MRVMLVLIVCAPLAGTLLGYANGGGSLWVALILGVLMTVGTLVIAWWLMGKTGVRRDWERALARNRSEEDR
jgi:flagellar basal body-associated protein FliL